MKKLKVTLFSLLTVGALLYVFVTAPNLSPLYFDGATFWATLITVYVGLWALLRTGELTFNKVTGNNQIPFNYVSKKKFPKAALITIAIPWALIAVVTIVFSVLFQWGAYRDQLGNPEIKKFTNEIQAVDTSQIPVVDKELAYKLAEKKLGERPSLGSQTTPGIPVIQSVDGELVWVIPLHHSGFFKWLTNMEGTPGYVVVSATNGNQVDYVEGFKIKYHPGSYLLHDVNRYVRLTSSLFHGMTDYSFELDDQGVPYWVISSYKNTRGFALPEADGILLMNASTGEVQRYGMDNIPTWVDRVQPEDFVMRQLNNKGQYVHGIFNFSNKDKFMTSPGHNIVYNNGKCYLFTGLTSVGSDESALGFVMVDMVTKESHMYQIAGATESAAQRSAQGKVQHLGYTATFPIILNIGGQPTYFMTLKDKEGLVKQYAMVSIVNYSTVGTGETIVQAMKDYQVALSNDGMKAELGPVVDEKTVTGTVLRIAGEFKGDLTVYRVILKEQPNQIYAIESSVSTELSLTQPDDKVTIGFTDVETGDKLASSFDNNQIGG